MRRLSILSLALAGIMREPNTGAGGGSAVADVSGDPKALHAQLEQKRAELDRKWESYGLKTLSDGSTVRDVPNQDREGIKKLHDEINEIAEKYDAATASEREARELARYAEENSQRLKDMGAPANRVSHGGGGGAQRQEIKSIGEMFIESAAFKNRDQRGRTDDFKYEDPDIDLKTFMTAGLAVNFKTTMTTGSDGYTPEVLRNPGIAAFSAQRPIQILDTLPMIPTTQNALAWMTETVLTNNAVETAEGSAAGEAVLTYAESTGTISWLPVFIPVTQIQLDDVPGLRGIIDSRLMFMVRQRLDAQVLSGNGTPPNIKGIRSYAGVQTQAKGSDTVVDALRKGIFKVNVTGRAAANVIYLNSTDKMGIDLTKNAQGNYIFTNPLDGSLTRLWGRPLVENEVLSAGTATVADTNYAAVRMRSGIDIAISDSHGEFFTAGKLAIRAAVRAGVEVYRGAAFCDVTGL
jgi:HK97 family phage major capsid protein